MMRCRKTLLDRKYPAPPPTPPGMVFGITKFIPAIEFQLGAMASMDNYDELPRWQRDILKEKGHL